MPAELVPNENIPKLAAQINSPVALMVLRILQQTGSIMNGQDLDQETIDILQRLAALGLVDPGYDGSTDGKPFIWVSNPNGDRVLRHLEGKAPFRYDVQVHPRAHPALASLSQRERQAVLLAAAKLLQAFDPTSWPEDKVSRLSPDKPVYLLRVSPQLRAFIRTLEPGGIELFDIVREETLRLFLERQQPAGAH
jgi:hypothetical protein